MDTKNESLCNTMSHCTLDNVPADECHSRGRCNHQQFCLLPHTFPKLFECNNSLIWHPKGCININVSMSECNGTWVNSSETIKECEKLAHICDEGKNYSFDASIYFKNTIPPV